MIRPCCPRSGSGGPLDGMDAGQFRPEGIPGALCVVAYLSAQPVAVRKAEIAAEAQVGIGGDRALAGHDVADALRGHADVLCEAITGNPHGFQELMEQDLAGMDGGELAVHDSHGTSLFTPRVNSVVP